MQVFYVNIGGGEPMLRPDFFDLVGYAVEPGRGEVLDQRDPAHPERARQLAAMDYLDVQISMDGATAATNDGVRGDGLATRRPGGPWTTWPRPDFGPFKISVVVTRENVGELDALAALADSYGAQLRLTRLRPSGPRRRHWDDCTRRPRSSGSSTTGCSSGPTCSPGTRSSTSRPWASRSTGSTCAAPGRVVCLIDPVGDVYACPFVIHDEFLAGNVRDPGGFAAVWRESALFASLRAPPERGRVRLVRLLRRLPRRVHGGQVLHRPAARRPRPRVRVRARRGGAGSPRGPARSRRSGTPS